MSLLGAEPERSVACLFEADDAIARQLVRVGGIEDGEPNTVESNEAVERREPDVARVVLDDRSDRIDRKSVFDGPRFVHPRASARVGCGSCAPHELRARGIRE